MSENKKQHEEEVDLGSLFKIIGKGFSNFFNFIGYIFKGVFHLLILFLLFIKKHLLKFTIAAIIGGGVGVFIEIEREDSFYSEMIVQPNYDSTKLLYTNIDFYNDLIKQGDSISLSKIFKISNKEASSLREFYIRPVKSTKDIITDYNELIMTIDTTSIKSYSYDDFKSAYTKYDYRFHEVFVVANDRKVFSKLTNPMISAISSITFFETVKKYYRENFSRTDSILRHNMTQIDSLRGAYMTAMVVGAQNSSQGTSINFSDKDGNTSKENELFNTYNDLNNKLTTSSKLRAIQSDIINVVLDFNEVGSTYGGITRNYASLLAMLMIGLVFVFLVVVELNKYLNNYKK